MSVPRKCEASVKGPQTRPYIAISGFACLKRFMTSVIMGIRPWSALICIVGIVKSVERGCVHTVGGVFLYQVKSQPKISASTCKSNIAGMPSGRYCASASNKHSKYLSAF